MNKKLIKLIREKLEKSNFQKKDYKRLKYTLKIKTYSYSKDNFQIYIHEYPSSIRFYIQDILSKEESLLEVWSDKYLIKRGFSNNGINDLFEEIKNLSFSQYDL